MLREPFTAWNWGLEASMSEDDGPITLNKLLEPEEEVIAKLPLKKGPFEIFCLLFGLSILSLIIVLIKGFLLDGSPFLDQIFQGSEFVESLIFLPFIPFIFFSIFNAKIVLTDRKIVKENCIWASVEAKSWAEIKGIQAKDNLLRIEFKAAGKILVLKTPDAAQIKKQLSPLLIAKKNSETIEKVGNPPTSQISVTEPEQSA